MRDIFYRFNKGSIGPRRLSFWILLASTFLVPTYLSTNSVYAEATQSSLSISTSAQMLSLNIMPSIGGTFAKSGNNTISVSTNNFTGYSLTVASEGSTSLISASEDEIETLTSPISQATFIGSGYVNQWGYMPSQYITTNGGIDTVVSNTDFLPAPSTEGDKLAVTNSPNNSADEYTIAFGAKVDYTLPAGAYEYTYVLAAVPNSIVQTITYDANSENTVSNMPSPNPQAVTIDGGTPAAESYAVLSNTVPVLNGKVFNGWCDEPTSVDSETGDQVCGGTMYAAGSQFGIDQTTDTNNTTLYAVWVDTLFPIVWNQMGACEFHGNAPSNITGSECTDYHDSIFIDTGVPLYSQANYLKDYEIHFKIDHYNASEQTGNDNQQTFVNDKVATSASSSTITNRTAPGLVVRRSSSNIEFNSKINNNQIKSSVSANDIVNGGGDVSVFRIDNKIYYSINGGPLVFVQDITGFTQFFGLTTWFGGYPSDSCTGDTTTCTNAKRYIEATLSNMYIRLGKVSDNDVHTITFNANGGTTSTSSYLVKDGNAITTLPTAEYTDYVFQGWFTEQTGGTEVQASTVPANSTTYWAHWLGSVSLAEISNSSVILQPNATETINVTNAASLEPYTFASNNTGVATVNSQTGEVTAVAPGVTTIIMTGTTTGATKTINITVTGATYTVSFDAQGGSAVADVQVGDGAVIDPLPTSTRADYQLEGWYTGTEGTGTKLTTSTVFNENTPRQYYANWTTIEYVCKVATVQHEESCNRSSGGCKAAGYALNDPIYYGSLITTPDTTPVAGDAFTCNINNDSTFDEEDERFYFIGMNGSNAKLLYYKNISNDELSYSDGLTVLPSTDAIGWTNPNLTTFSSSDYSGSYDGKVARFMQYDEAVEVCGNSTSGLGTNGKCTYIMEKSNFANTNIRDGYWLGSTNNARVHSSSRNITTNSQKNGVRPVIEVPMTFVSLDIPAAKYILTFNPHNDTTTFTVEITPGDAIGAGMPIDPTYTDHIFQGWFTESTGGTQIDSTTEPSGDTTYHAQWLKTVALAELANNGQISVEPNGTATINVTNSAELESYTFSSNDTSIATVDSLTGVVTGVANGSTTITMTGTTSGATKTINVTVASLLPVTQAIISNDDLTLTEGGQITVTISNSAELEPYTFSSADTSIATVDANTGVVTGVGAGTTNIIMTGTNSGLTKTLEIDVIATPVTMRTVTFNSNGGSSVSPASVEDGSAIGNLPTTTRANYKFFGWYTDNGTFYNEVTPDTIVDSDVDYYAKWVEDTTSFPIVFSEINECTFNGDAVISGTYCTQDKTKKYIDSGVALFSTANYEKDFEIGFTVVELNSTQQNQATLVNSKRENSATNYPGFVMRNLSNTTNYELTAKFSNGTPTAVSTDGTALKAVKIVRQDGVLKYSFNGGDLTTWFDVSGNTHRFDTNVWFGAAVTSNDTGTQRYLQGKLTDMYIKLGAPTEYIVNFDANGGTVSESSRTIAVGDPVGTLPTPTPPNENSTFEAWYDESVTPAVAISASTIPDSNKTYVAHYTYNSSDTPVEFNIANNATRGYQTIINGWVQSPIDITTFNEASPINSSTWGDTAELSETNFWSGLRNNFVTNECMVPSYGDAATTSVNTPAWASGSVDCSKPEAYDTGIDAALNVYLDDATGTQVVYADADDGIIHNMIPGQTYYWEKADDSSVYGYVTATSVNGRRFVDAGKIRNVRDLGGLPVDTDDDGAVDATLSYGRLFRGERLWNAPATELTKLGINKEYDVGDPSEYSGDTKLSDYQNDQVIHYNFDYTSGDENNATSNYMRAWTAVTDIMTDIVSNNKNIYFHCRVGADRTGTVAYLLEGLLGVPDEARYEEYSLTHLSGLYDRTRYYKQKSASNALKFVYMMGYLSTTQDIYDWYMQNPNADANLIQNFRRVMTQ